MQGGEPGIEPGIAEQCWKPVDALQPGWITAELSRIFGWAVEAGLFQSRLKWLCREFCCAPTASHGLIFLLHGPIGLKTGDEALINVSLDPPQPTVGWKCPRSPASPGLRRSFGGIAYQLNCLGLGSPRLQRLTTFSCKQIARQDG